jgi:putative hydrolase of HD superfamily
MNILYLAFQVGISKKLPRTGWVMSGIKDAESVAEHCFRVNVLSMVLAPYLGVDQDKLIKMSIIHDLGETATGDLIIQRGAKIFEKERKEKEKIEEDSIKAILWKYSPDYQKLFHEMIQRKTRESIVFWEIDQFEKAIQAYEYEKEQGVDLTEFIEGADAHIKTPLLKQAMTDLKNLRHPPRK